MKNLFVLGSRPRPNLPKCKEFDVACANASVYQAKKLGLINPKLTMMSYGFLAGDSETAQTARKKLLYLSTENVIYFKHRAPFISKNWIKKTIDYRFSPVYAKLILKSLKFNYKRFNILSSKEQYLMPIELLGNDIEYKRKDFNQKYPSTGIYTILWGIKMGYNRIIISGIGLDNESGYFFKTKNYYRGHIEIDTLILNRIIEHFTDRIFTADKTLSNKVNIPFFDGNPGVLK